MSTKYSSSCAGELTRAYEMELSDTESRAKEVKLPRPLRAQKIKNASQAPDTKLFLLVIVP